MPIQNRTKIERKKNDSHSDTPEYYIIFISPGQIKSEKKHFTSYLISKSLFKAGCRSLGHSLDQQTSSTKTAGHLAVSQLSEASKFKVIYTYYFL